MSVITTSILFEKKMTKNDEAVLCGSCEGKPVIVKRIFMGKLFYSVQCSKCGCHLGYWYSSEKSACNSWNTAWKGVKR